MPAYICKGFFYWIGSDRETKRHFILTSLAFFGILYLRRSCESRESVVILMEVVREIRVGVGDDMELACLWNLVFVTVVR